MGKLFSARATIISKNYRRARADLGGGTIVVVEGDKGNGRGRKTGRNVL